ncbi:MAG TPA: hypothetical protein PKE58_00555 [Acidobacteriota bacterium]|nr:hypothetical protein [Acidobacteriota bacterium]
MTRPTTKNSKRAVAQVAPTADIVQYSPGNVYTKAFDWTARLKMPANHKRVLDFLIRICGREGRNTCCQTFIAERLGISTKTVERAVANIEARQFVVVRRGYQTPSHYTIHPDILKAAWTEADRAESQAEIGKFARPDKVPDMLDSYRYSTCMDPSSAHAHARTREEMLSASRVSEENGAVEEQKALIGEIVEIRNQLYESNPERYPKIISPKAYAGKLSTKSTPELKTELENNRKVLENSKKPKSVTVSGSAQSIMAQASEMERTTFTGFNEPWFLAWSTLDEKEQIGWRERTEAQLWHDSGWDEWCRQHPDPVEQELGRRRATRNLFRYEWEQLQQYQQDMEQTDAAAAPAVDLPADRQHGQMDPVADSGRIVAASPDATSVPDFTLADSRSKPVTNQPVASQVTPANAEPDPDNDQPPTSPKPKRQRQQRREHRKHRECSVNRPAVSPATSQVSPQRGSLTMPEPSETSTPAGNVVPFRRPVRSLDPDSRPRMRGPDDG